MHALQNQPGVTINLDKQSGTVGEKVQMKGKGLPANQTIDLVWNTMVGSRVTAQGFAEKSRPLDKVKTDNFGSFTYTFPVPDDLGGVPHRIDLMVGEQIYGQGYLLILPSISKITPTSGPAGTEITVEIKGVGWTEYDNAYHLTYDNSYTGYMCGFNSQGTVTFTLFAAGDPGYHLLDLYPGIYRGEKKVPDVYTKPQLTYGTDHPGTRIPAIRLGFEITK